MTRAAYHRHHVMPRRIADSPTMGCIVLLALLLTGGAARATSSDGPRATLGFPVLLQRQLFTYVLFVGPGGVDVRGRLERLREAHRGQHPEPLAVDDSRGGVAYFFSLDVRDRRVKDPPEYTPHLELFGVEGAGNRAAEDLAAAAHVMVFLDGGPTADEGLLERLRARMRPERRAQVLRLAAGEDLDHALIKVLRALEQGRWQ